MWVRKENNGKGDGSPELGHLGVLGPTVFKALKVLFKDMQLDVTHRDDPPNHTLALLGQLPGQISNEQVDFTQISEVILEGGGLAAWNIPAPPFQVHLQKVDPTYLPGLGNIPVNISMDFPNFSDSLQVLRGII
jgi:hypothetical protein